MIGELAGSYRITGVLGKGGMGVVYTALHPLLGRRAVVKMLLPDLSSRTEMVERFFNEARASTLIRHPGIVDIFDFGYHASGSAFIVMELLEGETLARRLQRLGPMASRDAARVGRQLASALGAAHGCGIVHRDLKPDNVFIIPDPTIDGGERVKVLDFGIAKLNVGSAGSNPTRTGAVMGTPLYMAPEQCQSAAQVDGRADIYALGCILFELVAGRPPFLGESIGQLVAGHMFEAPPLLRMVAPDADPGFEDVVARCLAKSPLARPATMVTLAAALDGVGDAAWSPASTTFSRSAGEVVNRPGGRGRAVAGGLVGLGVAGLLGGLGLWAVSSSRAHVGAEVDAALAVAPAPDAALASDAAPDAAPVVEAASPLDARPVDAARPPRTQPQRAPVPVADGMLDPFPGARRKDR